MKRLALITLLVGLSLSAMAQGNPYAMIGPVPMVEYAMPFERMPRLANADTTGDTAAMLIDGYGGKIYYVDAADSILGTAELPDDAVLMWLSVDPLTDKYPGISPYAYCLWNPMRYVDPDGMEIDDYFSKTGVYLGYDNAKTDNVRIIDEALWNDLSQGGKIEHSAGYAASQSFSSASISMSDEAQLEVYRHYNTTNCELYAASSNTSPNNSGMVTRTKNNISKIGIYLKGNFKGIAVADHSSEIINMFVHEEQHVVDHRGGTFIFDYEYENSALMRQFNHSSWLRCRPEFRRSVVDYGRKVSTLPPFVLDFWDPYTNPFE